MTAEKLKEYNKLCVLKESNQQELFEEIFQHYLKECGMNDVKTLLKTR